MFTKLIILAVVIQLSACGYIDVDSASIDSPSSVIDGDITTVTFDFTFTPVDGAARAINASHASTRFMLGGALSGADDGTGLAGLSLVNLTSEQQTVALSDDSSVTWSNLEIELNLTETDCGNGTVYAYLCFALLPYSGVTWSGVDTSNSSICTDLRCKATADVGIDSLTITNPDEGVLNIGGGQAVEFDLGISSTSGSNDIVGTKNWKVSTFLASDEDGSDPVATVSSATILSAQLTKDLSSGDSITLANVAANYDLTDVTCDDFDYLCATIAPHGMSYWQFSGNTLDRTVCTAVTCGASFAQMSVVFMLVCVAISRLFNNS